MARKKKHTTGEMLRRMTVFGYTFEVYEEVVIFYDNEEQDKSIEMQHHTFEDFINLYIQEVRSGK
jgi:hypothetical protein